MSAAPSAPRSARAAAGGHRHQPAIPGPASVIAGRSPRLLAGGGAGRPAGCSAVSWVCIPEANARLSGRAEGRRVVIGVVPRTGDDADMIKEEFETPAENICFVETSSAALRGKEPAKARAAICWLGNHTTC